jgi:hypothetical protein
MAAGHQQFTYNFSHKDMTAYIAYRACVEKIREFIDYSEQVIERYSNMDPDSEPVLYYRTYRNVSFSGSIGNTMFDVRYFEIPRFLHFFQTIYREHFHDDELERKFEMYRNDTYGLGGREDWVEYIQEQMLSINENEQKNIDIDNSFKTIGNDEGDHEMEIYNYSRKFWKMSYIIEGIISAACKMKSLEYDREIQEYVYNPETEDEEDTISFTIPNNEDDINLWDENATYITTLDKVYADYLEKKKMIKYDIIKMRRFKRASAGLRGM